MLGALRFEHIPQPVHQGLTHGGKDGGDKCRSAALSSGSEDLGEEATLLLWCRLAFRADNHKDMCTTATYAAASSATASARSRGSFPVGEDVHKSTIQHAAAKRTTGPSPLRRAVMAELIRGRGLVGAV